MKWSLVLLMVAVLCAFVWEWQEEGNIENIALARSKSAVDRSAHDASLQVDLAQLGEGRVVFDQAKALQAFDDTLVKNMQLTSSLVAKPNTLFQGAVSVEFADYIDDSNVVQRFGSSFDGSGKLYSRQTANYSIQKMIYGPAVVYVIKFKKPMDVDSTNRYFYIASIFEYPKFQ